MRKSTRNGTPMRRTISNRIKPTGACRGRIDTWWLRARDTNYEDWVVEMPTTEFARTRAEHCKTNLVHRYAHSYPGEHSPPRIAEEDVSDHEHCPECHECHHDQDPDHDHDPRP